jgi:hypothetical protein
MDTNKFNKRATLTQVANVLLPDRLHNFHYERGLEPTLLYQISTTEQNRTAFKFSTKENLQATLGFMQVGLDVVKSAICKSHLQFQQTNIYRLLYISSTKYFQSAAVMGRRNSNSQPA